MWKKNKDVPTLLKALKKEYPKADCALVHDSALELLIATILSAQCTDSRVNIVTKELFKKYKTARQFAELPQAQLETHVRSTGFYRNKAKNIRGMAQMLVEKHAGEVPRTMTDLLELPGVARKTANVVLGTMFGIADGIVVDTHVMRLSSRLGLSKELNPVNIEQDLMKIIPKTDWIWLAHALIWHGRRVCTARNPRCPECPVRKWCANPVNL